jgi:pyruvate/2-oxoglutarate/acetoin dehydrogenase E1 component
MMYRLKDLESDRDFVIPLDVVDGKCEGDDITEIGLSGIAQVALGVAALLEDAAIGTEVVVNPRTTWPPDEKTLIESYQDNVADNRPR